MLKTSLLALLFVQSFCYGDSFSGKDILTHKTIQLPTLGVSVLVFLSAKCPCSASHENGLKMLYTKFQAQGVRFFGIHSNQDESQSKTFTHFKASAFAFPVIEDAGAKIANAYHVDGTPNAILIKDGKVMFEGGMDDHANAAKAKAHYLENALNEVLANKPVTVAKAKDLGCAIKRNKI